MNLFHMLKGKFWKFYQSSDKKENRKENDRLPYKPNRIYNFLENNQTHKNKAFHTKCFSYINLN